MNIFEKAAELEKQNIAFALVTIIKSEGSTPRSQAKMIVLADGSTFGTVGGGIAEHTAIQRACELIGTGKNDVMEISLSISDGHHCGGAVELFIEIIPPAKRLILIGGGHVNLEIARLASACSFFIELVETRPEFGTKERFPWVSLFHLGATVDEALASVEIDEDCALIIATHNLDKQFLEQVITSPARYIGMLGSRTKVNGYKRSLKEIKTNPFERFYSPLGLDIGSETPNQIAVGAVAELLMVLNNKTGKSLRDKAENLVVVRGAGDLATGVIHRLHRAGYRVLALETNQPTTIRRTVAFSEAVYEGAVEVEGVICRRGDSTRAAKSIMDSGSVALLVDPKGESIATMAPMVVVDAIMAKRNMGTKCTMAPFVVALGPGFNAPQDCHVVVETQRGHDLGRLITQGAAVANTGIPGTIEGYSTERVIHSPVAGRFKGKAKITDHVVKDQIIALVGDVEVPATIDGVLRGLLHDDLIVTAGFKIADIDPRSASDYCQTMSDKARAIGGAVLEAIDGFHAKR
ncbi:MAG: selenium-dependent molybdenum cofactor biosynthesis protein YqeB [Sphaerochaetaceae bacterium]|nr:selenium-dependent molybdenum cofactor biosynthesis protein YqeB [Sphaerochaetaceae bacterium]